MKIRITSRTAQIACWVLAAALLVTFFGARTWGELERQQAVTRFIEARAQAAIAAHRDGYFRVRKDVTVGDLLELESLSDQRSYRITEIYIVEPTDVSPLYATNEPTVALVTCYPFYFVGNAPQRFIVRAVAVEF